MFHTIVRLHSHLHVVVNDNYTFAEYAFFKIIIELIVSFSRELEKICGYKKIYFEKIH